MHRCFVGLLALAVFRYLRESSTYPIVTILCALPVEIPPGKWWPGRVPRSAATNVVARGRPLYWYRWGAYGQMPRQFWL